MPFDFITGLFDSAPAVDPTSVDPTLLGSGSFDPTAISPVSPSVYPDGSGGFTDINGYPVDSTGQPITFDSNGNQIDSNGNIINQAQPYTPSPADQTITPGGTDASGNILDANGQPVIDSTGSPIKAGSAAAKALGYGVTAAGAGASTGAAGGSSLLGSLGKALFGGNTASGGSSSTDWLLPLLGGALAGYMLPRALGVGNSGTAPTIQAPNYYEQFGRTNLPNYNPGIQPIVGLNPGYQMTGTQLPTGPVAPKA